MVISDGAGVAARGAGGKGGDNGLVNFLFYCTLGLCAWGGMGAVRQYAGKVSASKGASTSMMTSSQTANWTGGLLPGDAKPSLPAAQKKAMLKKSSVGAEAEAAGNGCTDGSTTCPSEQQWRPRLHPPHPWK